ncbi:SMI1/KNR4 family protein [Kitasatospora viridis]|uniref:SMI1/KNR4 family protein n=1 Tax=Kitasatospora viridis TaxID=281105 RepID=A0A561UIN4_9ACTN|nr:SMI1/KNR4 family protein [Kitasatospora viridis]TWF99199.1 hypothetical protein FHX73_113040 [Kitasatospora viridis]
MTTVEDLALPPALAAALAVPLPRGDDDWVDFEPFAEFDPAEETLGRLRLWTGNPGLDGDLFRLFGQDGTGGQVAFWLVRPGLPVAEQPVVFLGSEGETAVPARDLADFLWLLAAGYGPVEAVGHAGPDWTPRPAPELVAVAERYAPGRRRPAAELLALAAGEFPDFDDVVMELCG